LVQKKEKPNEHRRHQGGRPEAEARLSDFQQGKK
jgi:hypothetical protein